MLLINGVLQGQMDLSTGRALNDPGRIDYIHNLHLLAHSHAPRAKTALQLGLGAGLLPTELARRGVKVRAVEIEPQIARLAREKFNLPRSVDVILADGRSFLRHDASTYDLIFLDTFASESTAWYLLTKEAFEEMRARLNPGGRLVINTVAYAGEDKPGLSRIEASLLAAFPQALCYPENPATGTDDPEELINVTLVAGDNLRATMELPDSTYTMTSLAQLIRNERPAAAHGPPTTDDRSDLDYAQAPLRIRWRTLIWGALDSSLLWD
jgi:SAM-dependent methyltransferase